MNQPYPQFADFLPLILFAYGTPLIGHSLGGSCAHAFYLGAVCAILHIAYCWLYHAYIDFIALGADLFLIGGALLAGWSRLPHGEMGAMVPGSLLFVAIFIVGLGATVLSQKGFIQLAAPTRPVTLGSIGLLCLTAFALILSHILGATGSPRIGVYLGIPFVCLLIIREILRGYLLKHLR